MNRHFERKSDAGHRLWLASLPWYRKIGHSVVQPRCPDCVNNYAIFFYVSEIRYYTIALVCVLLVAAAVPRPDADKLIFSVVMCVLLGSRIAIAVYWLNWSRER